MIVTFLLTGARLREIVHLDKGDIDLHQATIRLHRKGGEVNILPLAESAKDRTQGVLSTGDEEPNTGVVHILPQSKNFTWDCLVSSEEIFQEIPNHDTRHGTSRFAAYVRDAASKSGRESKSHSESYESQESCDDGSVSAFSKLRAGKSRKQSKAVGRLK